MEERTVTVYTQPLEAGTLVDAESLSGGILKAAGEGAGAKALTDIGEAVLTAARDSDPDVTVSLLEASGDLRRWKMLVETAEVSCTLALRPYTDAGEGLDGHTVMMQCSGSQDSITGFVRGFVEALGRHPCQDMDWEAFEGRSGISRENVLQFWDALVPEEPDAHDGAAGDDGGPTPPELIRMGVERYHRGEKAEEAGDAGAARREYGEAVSYWETALKLVPEHKSTELAIANVKTKLAGLEAPKKVPVRPVKAEKTAKVTPMVKRRCPACSNMMAIRPVKGQPLKFTCSKCGTKGEFKRKPKTREPKAGKPAPAPGVDMPPEPEEAAGPAPSDEAKTPGTLPDESDMIVKGAADIMKEMGMEPPSSEEPPAVGEGEPEEAAPEEAAPEEAAPEESPMEELAEKGSTPEEPAASARVMSAAELMAEIDEATDLGDDFDDAPPQAGGEGPEEPGTLPVPDDEAPSGGAGATVVSASDMMKEMGDEVPGAAARSRPAVNPVVVKARKVKVRVPSRAPAPKVAVKKVPVRPVAVPGKKEEEKAEAEAEEAPFVREDLREEEMVEEGMIEEEMKEEAVEGPAVEAGSEPVPAGPKKKAAPAAAGKKLPFIIGDEDLEDEQAAPPKPFPGEGRAPSSTGSLEFDRLPREPADETAGAAPEGPEPPVPEPAEELAPPPTAPGAGSIGASLVAAAVAAAADLDEPDEADETDAQEPEAAPSRGPSVAELNERGVALAQKGIWHQALDQFDKALGLDPAHLDSLNDKGVVLFNMGRKAEAMELYEKVHREDPERVETWFNKAHLLLEEGRLGHALDCFKKVLEVEPDNGDAWYFRGLILFRLERFGESAKNFEQAVKIDSRDTDSWFNYAYALEMSRDYEKALGAYQTVLRIEPEHGQAGLGREACLREIRMELLKDWQP